MTGEPKIYRINLNFLLDYPNPWNDGRKFVISWGAAEAQW